ncbi:MAG: glycosyltransferase family 39 protein [Planctomycetota bacterium]
MSSAALNGTSGLKDGAPVSLRSSDHDPTIKLFWILLTGHVLIWMAVCLLTQPNMPLDMVEMLFWGQQWQLGYHKHPPLPAWTAASAWWLSGGHPWSMYLVSQATIAVTFWAVWQFARESLSPRAALCSVVVLQACYYCTFLINDINNTIVTRPFWALAVLFLFRALAREKTAIRNLYWILAGVAIGLGMLCKYYMGVLVLAMIAVPVFVPAVRKELRTAGPWLTFGTALLIFLPHLLWMIDNDFITIRYVLDRSGEAPDSGSLVRHLTSPLNFLLSQLPAVIPVLLVATPLLMNRGAKRTVAPNNGNPNQLFWKYLLIIFFGPVVIYVLLGAVTGATIRTMWGGPLFSFLGVFLFAAIPLPEDHSKVRKMIRDAIIIGLFMAVALVGRNVLGPKVRGEQSRVHFPGQSLSTLVQQRWNEHYTNPLPIVGGELFLAGCVGVYNENAVDVYGDMSVIASPWTDDRDLSSRGGIVVWDQNENGELPPPAWMQRFASVEILDPVVCRSQSVTDDVEVRVGVALVHPTSPGGLAFAVNRIGNTPISADSPERIASEPGSTSPIVR